MPERHEVIVVGAGPVGLTCALKLSRAGKRMHEGIVPMARRFEQAWMASLSDGDRAALERLMVRLMDNAVALDRDGF